jgi:hypothetical protein
MVLESQILEFADFGICKGGWVTYFFVADLMFWGFLVSQVVPRRVGSAFCTTAREVNQSLHS